MTAGYKNLTGQVDAYIERVRAALSNLDSMEINAFINALERARQAGRQIFIMGNGGSASTASHFVCDFNKGVSYASPDKPRFKFICLNDSVSQLSAYANDVGYEDAFLESLKNFFNPGDVVIGISGSGNSKNILNAVEYANANGGLTIGITGYDGGRLREMASLSVNAKIDDMQVSEDIHMILDHLVMSVVRDEDLRERNLA